MTRVLLVPDLPIERWPSMDRYASRLAATLPAEHPGLEIALASPVAPLTDEVADRRSTPDARAWTSPAAGELRRYLERYLVYPRRLRRRRADVLHVLDHSYAHMLRARPDVPRVVTVHDLMPLLTLRRRTAGVRQRIRNVLLRGVLRALREADCWIVSTEWMRGELGAWLGHGDHIHVIPYGVDDAFFTAPGVDRVQLRRHLGVPADRFLLLHVGSVVERKNVPAVLAALDGLRARGIDAGLLQVGGRFTAAQREEIAARGLDPYVAQRPDAVEADLRAAYRAADALLFPSLYEGFGLPVLEAMASELPIVTSAAPALAEVAGDAAIVIDSRDPDAYAAALERIATDSHRADQLRRNGRTRAWQFTWAETARRTGDVYRRLV